MANIILPQIINAGIYDAAAVHKNQPETPKRHVSVFEIELPFYEGGLSFINEKNTKFLPIILFAESPGRYVTPVSRLNAVLFI